VIEVEAVALTVNEPLGAGVAVGLGFGVALGLGPLRVTVNCACEAPTQAPIASMIISDLNRNSFLRKFITFLLSMVVGGRPILSGHAVGLPDAAPQLHIFLRGVVKRLDNRTMHGYGLKIEKRIHWSGTLLKTLYSLIY
jgi:hypothetical protein